MERSAASKWKNVLYFGTILGLVACMISWLLISQSSPFFELLVLHDLWGFLNFPVFIVSIALNLGDIFYLKYFLIFVQWFLIGSLFGLAKIAFSQIFSILKTKLK
jgi:hypothetical protein